MEVHGDRLIDNLEVLKVGSLGELIATAHVDIIHKDILILADELEGTGTLYSIFSLLLVVGLLLPFAGSEIVGRGNADTVTVTLGLVEEVIFAIFGNDVTVDA